MSQAPPAIAATDPRVRAFCTPEREEIFHAVAHSNEIYRPDPYDVESIHAEARDLFERLVTRAGITPRPLYGRILLLKGESGAGKTHLMRAFRNWTHEAGRGYCGYMQMTSYSEDYGQYVLNNLIDSLGQPYYAPQGDTTGLMRLSTAIAESSKFIALDRLTQLRDDDLDPVCLGRLVEAMADQIIMDDRYNECDTDLIRALLYLQRNDPRLQARVFKYLRCEDLTLSDSEVIGGLKPRIYADAPQRLVTKLGHIMGQIESVPLILCLDQLEGISDFDNADTRFSRAMSTVCTLADKVPSSVIVISCLENLYDDLRARLPTPTLYRIEKDPAPIQLSVKRDLAEVEQLIARRLEALYEPLDIEIDPADPTFPIPASKLPELVNLPTRLILDWCRDYRDACIAAGALVPLPGAPIVKPEVVVDPPTIALEQLWNDARSRANVEPPGDDAGLARLLAWSIARCSDERDDGHTFAADPQDILISVRHERSGQPIESILVGLCNKSARGGGLGKQVDEVDQRAKASNPPMIPVIIRSSDFPPSPTAVVSKRIGQIITGGGRRAVVDDSDWRVMATMRAFLKTQGDDPRLASWLIDEKPLSRLESLRKILGLDEIRLTPTPTPPSPPSPRPPSNPTPQPEAVSKPATPPPSEPLAIGQTDGVLSAAMTINPADLTMHAAFLGGTGSGKTTLALNLIEQLLLRGVPAILVDRKGDLCQYANPDAWTGPVGDPAMEARRQALRDRVEIALFTPGNPDGRPLTIAAIPPGLGAMTSNEREQAAKFAASGLGGMMNYKEKGDNLTRLVILSKAIEVLSQAHPEATPTLPDLLDLIDRVDPTLANALGKIDTKHCGRLVQDLETIRHAKSSLLAAQGEPMEAEALLGLGRHARPGKTRLTIISTKFLGPKPEIRFWVAQLLMELTRWSNRSPSKTLQAVVLFDEADIYLPATEKPATKEPMENLLKRARSAGLGLFLATQSPGDFDYRCRENIRSWFVGHVQEANAINKMKPMLSASRVDISNKLPSQTTGQFHLIREGEVVGFHADRSFLKTEQMADDEIARLAHQTRSAS